MVCAATGDRHVDACGAACSEPPERRRAAVAQHGVAAAGQDCRHPLATSWQERLTDGIYAGMDHVQAPRPDPMVDRAWSEADGEELTSSHDAVLPRSELGEAMVLPRTWTRSTSHIAVNRFHAGKGGGRPFKRLPRFVPRRAQ